MKKCIWLLLLFVLVSSCSPATHTDAIASGAPGASPEPEVAKLDIPRDDTQESRTVSGVIGELNIAGGDALSSISFSDGSVGTATVDYAPQLDTVSTESDIGKLTINEAGERLRLFAYRPIGALEYDGELSATVYTDGFDLSVLTANKLRFLQIADWYDYDLTPLQDIELVDGLTLRVEDQENETIAVPKDSDLLSSNSNAEQKAPSYVSIRSKEEIGREWINIYPPEALYTLETDLDEEDIDILVEFARRGGTIRLASRYNCKPRTEAPNNDE